ncbi:CoA ester lyase [Pseudomonas ogarae]|uniref:HpcH/HpaI aldolase/citrate lyase family protein n=1 Tax=Pseudomonas ogarae (strain DSM 112162 / CECT 30235 / F113) TaxID=1114970 RepID=UPI0009A28117|nr:CoA ester lyase [Pseudomonas ogarae]OPG72048.1 CoA ester lyase [Pseudomonas ogarae]
MSNPKIVRSALFVPGSRPERFPKAFASGADVVIVDFEDAVEENLKEQAQENLAEFLAENPATSVVVRINAADHRMHLRDIEFCSLHAGISAVLVPKAESSMQILTVAESGKPLWPLIESAKGLVNLSAISSALSVQRLTFGALDLALDLGIRASSSAAYRVFDQVRYQILVNSSINSLEKPLDTVYPNIADVAGLTSFVRDARDLGFSGMLAIHPGQVEVINQAFTPSDEEIIWAKRVLEASQGAPGAFRLDGKMIDPPVIAEASRIVAFYDT